MVAAHVSLVFGEMLVSRVSLPRPSRGPISISIVSQTVPQGMSVPQHMLSIQSNFRPALTAQSLPGPPPPVPLVPRSQPIPGHAAQSARGPKITAGKLAAVTVAVAHPAVSFADNQAPDYLRAAIDAREQGVVRFKLYLGKDGRVRRFQLTRSSGYADLDASVRRAALAWRYHPAMRGGVAVPSVVKFHVEFLPQ